MNVNKLEWDEIGLRNIAKHDVETDEVEEALVIRPYFLKSRENAYQCFGVTETGRYLEIAFELHNDGTARPFHARDMTKRERQMYLRKRK